MADTSGERPLAARRGGIAVAILQTIPEIRHDELHAYLQAMPPNMLDTTTRLREVCAADPHGATAFSQALRAVVEPNGCVQAALQELLLQALG